MYCCLLRDLTDVYLLYVAFRYCISVFQSHREYAVYQLSYSFLPGASTAGIYRVRDGEAEGGA